MNALRYVHAGDLDTNDAHDLVWNVGEIGDRYQEIAIDDDRVVGSWTYYPEWNRRRLKLRSGRTDVTPRFQHKGVARALWMRGVARWKPTTIEATISTDQGRDFLARMRAWLSFYAPETFLHVSTRAEDRDTWESHVQWAALQLLKRLGEQALEAQRAKQPTPALQLVKGAK